MLCAYRCHTIYFFIHTHILMVTSSTVLGLKWKQWKISSIEQYMG